MTSDLDLFRFDKYEKQLSKFLFIYFLKVFVNRPRSSKIKFLFLFLLHLSYIIIKTLNVSNEMKNIENKICGKQKNIFVINLTGKLIN